MERLAVCVVCISALSSTLSRHLPGRLPADTVVASGMILGESVNACSPLSQPRSLCEYRLIIGWLLARHGWPVPGFLSDRPWPSSCVLPLPSTSRTLAGPAVVPRISLLTPKTVLKFPSPRLSDGPRMSRLPRRSTSQATARA